MRLIESALVSMALVAPALTEPLPVSVSSISDWIPPFPPTPTTLLAVRQEEKCDAGTFRCGGDYIQECIDGKWTDTIECHGCRQEGDMMSCKGPFQRRRVNPSNAPLSAPQQEIGQAMLPQKRGHDHDCTPGDRVCHASLEKVLFCNDSHDWSTYSECNQPTFCHRLFMICVDEYTPTVVAQLVQPTASSKAAEDADKCKEGDRKCNGSFNRVDRCNSDHDWVTYHDCRKSESCNDLVFECIPLGSEDVLVPPSNKTSPRM